MVNEEKVRSSEAKIIGGPNKWDLIIKSLADSNEVFFDLEDTPRGTAVRVQVQGLIKLGMDDVNWLVLGRVLGNFKNLANLFNDQSYLLRGDLTPVEKGMDDPVYFWAKYDCQSRCGQMRIAIINPNEDSPWDPKYFPF